MPTSLSKVYFQGKVLQEEKLILRQSYEKIILETLKTISDIMNAGCHDNQWHFCQFLRAFIILLLNSSCNQSKRNAISFLLK